MKILRLLLLGSLVQCLWSCGGHAPQDDTTGASIDGPVASNASQLRGAGFTAATAQLASPVLAHHVPAIVSSGQAARVGSLPESQSMNVSMVLPLRNSAALANLLADLYDPSSPKFRQFLSVAEFTEQFGPTADDYGKVVRFAQASGLAVTDSPDNHLIVPVRGTVAQIQSAFGVTLNVYQHPTENRTFYAPDREPTPAVGVALKYVAGLDNFVIPHHAAVKATSEQMMADVIGSGPGGTSYVGSDLRAAYYGGTALTGSGQAVGLYEYQSGYDIADVNETFRRSGQTYSVPINNVVLDQVPPGANGSDVEQVMDIVAAIGMAPGLSQVRVYMGNVDVDIYNKMASENIAKQLSVSWIRQVDDSTQVEPIFQEMAAQGQTLFAATGDWGSYPAPSYGAYPAEDPYVTGVGGTDLLTSSAGGSWLSETAWTASGGGISPDGIAIPSWQTGVANSLNGASKTLRNSPDVAALANPSFYICETGECSPWGGTSLATPLWAGFMALVNQQAVEAGKAPKGGLGFINPALYAIGEGSSYANDFHDVSGGSNGGFQAVTGYDLVTGWGSPKGQNLINALAGAPASGFTLKNSAMPNGLFVAPGASGTTTIAVNDMGGFTGAVALAVSGLPSGVTASFSTSPTTASSVLTLKVAASVPYTKADIIVTGTSGSKTTTTSFALTVAAPHLDVYAMMSLVTLYPGSSISTTIAASELYGLTGNLTFAASGLPAGVTASFVTNQTTGTSVLTLTANSTAPYTTVTSTITGTVGAQSASANLQVTVSRPFFLIADNQSVTINQGGSSTAVVHVIGTEAFGGNVTLSGSGGPSGVTAVFSPNPTTGTEDSTLTLTASQSAALGNATLTVTGTWGSQSVTLPFYLTVNPPLNAPKCTIGYTTTPQGSSTFGAAITITNGGPAMNGWTLTWSFANGQKVTSLWNGIETQSGANVTVTSETYNGQIAPGGTLTGIGFNGTWNGVTNAIPTAFALNGAACVVN